MTPRRSDENGAQRCNMKRASQVQVEVETEAEVATPAVKLANVPQAVKHAACWYFNLICQHCSKRVIDKAPQSPTIRHFMDKWIKKAFEKAKTITFYSLSIFYFLIKCLKLFN